ncbi:hypothetical protein GCM10027515_15270 [Schumannella luteola]|uniref:Tfp pilus assembly protein PilW n=1 Tax=Schumannella luteola TaxID=472059 RepID=A0A852YDS2_9MICO|nr:hypothetical protein [Schumannella luteola]NYH00674.1 Tfp pilus assembly protein PilW [Schumannella luteola]TPX04498.1 hypothetical protein FJ656_11565 [Schumannella luteola]
MIGAIKRRLQHGAGGEAGISLIEMIVGMALTALVLSLVGTMLVQVGKVTTLTNDRSRSTAEAQNVLDAMSTDIRAGVNIPGNSPITWAVRPGSEATVTGEKIRLITYSDVARPNPIGMPLQVAYSLENGTIVRNAWTVPSSSASYPLSTAPSNKRNLGSRVTAFSLNYIQGTCPAPASSPCTVSTVTTTNVGLIIGVNISLTAQAAGSTVPVSMSTTVYLPNAGSTQKYAGS